MNEPPKIDCAPCERALTKIALAIVALWLVIAALLPTAPDEAYYYVWAKHLAFGYFDHPPLVALMTQTARILPGNAFVARLGTVAMAAVSLFVSLSFFKKLGIKDPKTRVMALLLSHANLLGLIFGALSTPDVCLMFAWVLTLHELAAALTGNPRRWVTAGMALGLGLQAKYTMGLMAFVALIAAARLPQAERARRGLASPWPWAGALAGLLVFSPNLIWNAQHDWLTINFQLRHGLTMAKNEMTERRLPAPLKPQKGSPEAALARRFAPLKAAERKEELAPSAFAKTREALNRYIGFYASQIVLWGALSVVLGIWFWKRWRRKRTGSGPAQSPKAQLSAAMTAIGVAPNAQPLVVLAALLPLAVFGGLALFTKVEANWSAMYVFAAAVLLVPAALTRTRAVSWAAGINAVLVLIAALHAGFHILPVRPHQDRILKETHGYNSLAKKLETLEGPVFGDSFQIVSMVDWYSETRKEEKKIRQWPGITRDSEFVRNPELEDLSREDLERGGFFWLVTTDELPPRMQGFTAVDLAQLRDCAAGELQEISAATANLTSNRCKDPVHEWYLVRYERNASATIR